MRSAGATPKSPTRKALGRSTPQVGIPLVNTREPSFGGLATFPGVHCPLKWWFAALRDLRPGKNVKPCGPRPLQDRRRHPWPCSHHSEPHRMGMGSLKQTGHAIGSAAHDGRRLGRPRHGAAGRSARSGRRPARGAARGREDFGACRTDVIFLCLIYPIAGLDHLALRLRLRDAAADLPAGLGLRADRAVVRRRPLRDEPPARAGTATGWADAFGVAPRPLSARSWRSASSCWRCSRCGSAPPTSSRLVTLGPEPPVSARRSCTTR